MKPVPVMFIVAGLACVTAGAISPTASVAAGDRLEFKRVMASNPSDAKRTPTGAPLPPSKGQRGFSALDPRLVEDAVKVQSLVRVSLGDKAAVQGNESLFEVLATSTPTVYSYPDFDGSTRTEVFFDLDSSPFSGGIRMFNLRRKEPNALAGMAKGVTGVVIRLRDDNAVVSLEVREMNAFVPDDPEALARVQKALAERESRE